MSDLDLCYLCGDPIDEESSRDHVPPRQFYSKEIRNLHGPNLRTLPTHRVCNRAYQLDEEYFIHTTVPLALDSYSGGSIFREALTQYKRNRNTKLNQKVLEEFEKRPSGLYLPQDKIGKRIDPVRFWRVVWKIIRGLFFIEHGQFLPENTPRNFKIVPPGEKPPNEFYFIPDEPQRGQYPGVFDYKYRIFPEVHNVNLWTMLFWDRVIVTAIFHDPNCCCDTCYET